MAPTVFDTIREDANTNNEHCVIDWCQSYAADIPELSEPQLIALRDTVASEMRDSSLTRVEYSALSMLHHMACNAVNQ